MNTFSNAMKKLQESKRANSAELAKMVKESVIKEAEEIETELPAVEEPVTETPVETEVETKYNYKVVLDNGKEITATCSKDNLADAKAYFTGRTYKNTKTGEQAKVTDVLEINEEPVEATEENVVEEGFESKAVKDIEKAAKKDAKIMAEEFESSATKGIRAAAKRKAKIVAEEFGSEAKELNDNDPSQNKPFESETKDDMEDATKGNAINDRVDESKELVEEINKETQEQVEAIQEENNLNKAKELVEVIFGTDMLDETVEAAKRELSSMITPAETIVFNEVPEEEEEKEIVEESKEIKTEDLTDEQIDFAILLEMPDFFIESAQKIIDNESNIDEIIKEQGKDFFSAYKNIIPALKDFIKEVNAVEENKEVKTESIEEPVEAQEIEVVDEVTFEDIDDESFTEAFTKFIKENYKNAKEFKLESVKEVNGGLKFECKLVFNSGKETDVVLEAKGNIVEGKSFLRFYENTTFKHENAERSIMTATVKVENKVLSCEKLRYNFVLSLNENKRARICGTIN